MSKSTKSAKKRVNVQNLPTAAKELTKKEKKNVKGGVGGVILSGSGTAEDPFVMSVRGRPKAFTSDLQNAEN